MKSHWKRAVSGLLAMVMMVGMLPASAFAANTGGNEALTVYKTESGTTIGQKTTL